MNDFSAAYAVAFCAGLYFPPRLRWVLPLSTVAVMDVLLNVFHYHAPLLEPGILFFLGAKLLSFAALIWLGTCFHPKQSWLTLLSGGLLGAVLFYFITNFASWVYDPGYSKTLQGLLQALTSGLPGLPPTWTFFRNTLLSGGLFTGLFCGVMKMSEAAAETEEDAAEEAEPEAAPEQNPA